jgi:hypothetical protein
MYYAYFLYEMLSPLLEDVSLYEVLSESSQTVTVVTASMKEN